MTNRERLAAQARYTYAEDTADVPANLAAIERVAYTLIPWRTTLSETKPGRQDKKAGLTRRFMYLDCASDYGDYSLMLQLAQPQRGADQLSVLDTAEGSQAAWKVGTRRLDDVRYVGVDWAAPPNRAGSEHRVVPGFLSAMRRLVGHSVAYHPHEYSVMRVRPVAADGEVMAPHGVLVTYDQYLDLTAKFGLSDVDLSIEGLAKLRAPLSPYNLRA